MQILTTIYPVNTPVRVTYEFEEEFYFFDGVVTEDGAKLPSMRDVLRIGYVREYETNTVHNVYEPDKVESLESLHTPRES